MKRDLVDISLIIPAHNEQESLAQTVDDARRCYQRFGIDGEIVIVDDGSTDRTAQIAEQLCKVNPGIRSVRFEKKHGKTGALLAGFQLTSGKVIVIVDADLQYDLEEMPLLYTPIFSDHYDLVNGCRVDRKDNFLRKIPSSVYNKLNQHIFHVKVKDANSGFKAMRRELLNSITPFLKKDFHRYLVSIAGYVGYRILEVPISHRPRDTGTSKYSTPTRLATGLLDMLRARWILRKSRNMVKDFDLDANPKT